MTYVPVGSIKKGEALVTGGGGRETACGTCHGADLKGVGPVPALAGRSAGQTVRALVDFQRGARKGAWSALMKGAVEKLSLDDLIAVAAYTASREPRIPGVAAVDWPSCRKTAHVRPLAVQ